MMPLRKRLNIVHFRGLQLKVSVTSCFSYFLKNPIDYAFFGSLVITENDLKVNMLRKWEGFFAHTCLRRFSSTPSRNNENKTINRAVYLKNHVSDFWQVHLFFFYKQMKSEKTNKSALRMEKRSSFTTKRQIKIGRQSFVEQLSGNNLANLQPNWWSGC